MSLVEINDLVKHFPKHGGFLNRVIAKVHALNGVSFRIGHGETLGVVGESGCGKSTLGRVLVRLLQPTSGSVVFDGHDISQLSHERMLPFRRRMQIVFQDPNSSLNPRMTVDATLREAATFHRVVPAKQMNAYVDQLITKVGLRVDDKSKFPHEFSGGQKQRIGIARALAVNPEFIVADEPISALDVSIQAQVLNLMMDLKQEYSLTMLFISHDLKVVDFFCDRMLVMYLGYVVEEIACRDVASRAKHPYTQALLGANPIADPDQRQALTVLEGDVPSPYNPPPGCPFVTRCPLRMERCHQEMPPLVDHAPDHRVACWAVDPPNP
jgi:oligopeptide/dipeptide ABC transporter ATP-binding protein